MLIAVDIGNSTIGIALYADPSKSSSLSVEKVPTHPARTAGFYKLLMSQMIKEAHSGNMPASISAIVSSVVPARSTVITKALVSLCKKQPIYVNAGINSGLTFNVKEPFKLGADRIANAVAGVSHSKGRPAAIVDFGTATTITVVGTRLTFLGGAIFPGIDLMRKALHSETAKLPLVSTDAGVPEKSQTFRSASRRTALGKDTASSIISGIVYGTVGAVEKLIKMMEKEVEFKLQLVLTGGNALFMSSFINRPFTLRPNLTFEGLRLLYIKTANE